MKTANQKVSDLIRVAPFMTDFNETVIFNSFIKKHLNNRSLLLYRTRAVSHRINRLHRGVLRALLMNRLQHLMTSYQKVTILLFM